MSQGTCKIEDCGGRARKRSMCTKHYQRWRKENIPAKPKAPCSVEGCDDPAQSRGWCQHHYNRNRYTGSPTTGNRKPRYNTPQEAFGARTKWQGHCLVWTGTIYDTGYGEISTGQGARQLVHRWAWEQKHGKIPPRMQIDHMCHNRSCVNVDHLRLATPKQNLENMLRGNSGSAAGGIRGVAWDASREQWMATIGHNGKMTNLGRYESKEIAAAVALGARLALFKYNLADRSVLNMAEDDDLLRGYLKPPPYMD